MTQSKFNIFFVYEGSHIGYNSFSNEFILLEPLLYDLYNVGCKKNDFNELRDIHSEYYHFLIKQGFLVDETLNEFEKVKELSYKIDNDDSCFELTINPTMNCNFKCWYCYETHIKDSKMDQETIDGTIRFVENVITNQSGLKHFHISFFGGEPLLYFDKVIKPILMSVSKICKNKNISFGSGMTTNGLLIDQEMLNICKQYSLHSFQITLDGNKERHDKVRFISEGRGSFDKIVSNIISIAKNKLNANVRVNCSVETMNNIK